MLPKEGQDETEGEIQSDQMSDQTSNASSAQMVDWRCILNPSCSSTTPPTQTPSTYTPPTYTPTTQTPPTYTPPTYTPTYTPPTQTPPTHTPPTQTPPTYTPPTYTPPTQTPPTYTPPTYTPPTPTPPTTAPPTCIPSTPPHKNPSYPSITFSTNCDFCDHALYTLTCIPNAFECASLCANDRKCTHFTYIANLDGGTCRLKSAPGSGGAWATHVPSPSYYTCGYIPKRTYSSILLSICVGLDVGIGIN